MAELTELEKRKLLRERRAAKFLKGGASNRLNKITGSNNSTLSTSSPIDSTSSTPPPPQVKSPTPDLASRRISQTFDTLHHNFDNEQDPEIEDITNFMPKKSPIPDPLDELPEQPSNQDLEKMLQQMFQNAVPNHQQSQQPDPFGGEDLFLKMMQQMPNPNDNQPENNTSSKHQENQLKFKKFKNYFTIFRTTLILSLLFTSFISYDLRSSSIKIIYENEYAPKFSQSFIILEIFFFIIHFINIQRYDYHPGDSLISSMLPLVSLFLPPRLLHIVKLIPSYMDIYKIFQIDISLIILFFGIVSIL